MNTPINDGGPAFPRTGAAGHTSPQSGMTLRDWFAGQALPSLITAAIAAGISEGSAVTDSYAVADLMITARQQS